jgi:hypothetical protein
MARFKVQYVRRGIQYKNIYRLSADGALKASVARGFVSYADGDCWETTPAETNVFQAVDGDWLLVAVADVDGIRLVSDRTSAYDDLLEASAKLSNRKLTRKGIQK